MTKTLAAKDDVFFDYPTMQNFDQSPQVVVLPHGHWDVSLILALMTYTEWGTRWKNVGVNWDSLQSELDCLRSCLMSGCNLESLIDTLNTLFSYEGKSISQILSEQVQPTETRITLKQYFDAFEADDKIQYAPVWGMLSALSDILPDSLQNSYYIEDPADFTAKLIDSLLSNTISLFQTGIQAVTAGAETGELAADAIDVAGTSLDTIFSGITAGVLSFSAIADLVALFKSGQTPPANDNPDLHADLRILNNVFVEQSAVNVNCSPDVTVNCGGGNYQVIDGGTTTGEWNDGAEVVEPDPEGEPQTGFETWQAYYDYKCVAAQYYFDNYINTINNMTAFEGVVGGIALGAIIALLVISVPPVGIAALMVAIGAIAAYDIALCTVFGSIYIGLLENRDDIICSLYSAVDTGEVLSILSSETGTIISGLEISELIEQAFIDFCNALLSNNGAKVIFELDSSAADYTSTFDCTECGSTPGGESGCGEGNRGYTWPENESGWVATEGGTVDWVETSGSFSGLLSLQSEQNVLCHAEVTLDTSYPLTANTHQYISLRVPDGTVTVAGYFWDGTQWLILWGSDYSGEANIDFNILSTFPAYTGKTMTKLEIRAGVGSGTGTAHIDKWCLEE